MFKDEQVLDALRTKFVPVAVDQHIHRKLKDADGRLFADVLKQAGRGLGGRSQGVYIFSPGGKLLAFSNTASAEHVKRLMSKALNDFNPDAPAIKIEDTKPGQRYYAEPPEGALVLNVTTKVLGGYEGDESRRTEMHKQSLAHDHLWLRRDEKEALARGELLDSVKQRIVRFHLVDNTRGEPPFWRESDIRKIDITLKDGRITGSVAVRTDDGERGYEADVLGFVETKDGEVTRFDLVVKGNFWGEGQYTRGAPEGKFPLAVTFRLSDMACAADRVVPGAARGGVQGYLR